MNAERSSKNQSHGLRAPDHRHRAVFQLEAARKAQRKAIRNKRDENQTDPDGAALALIERRQGDQECADEADR